MSLRILLLSADFGSGHLTAAKAIAEQCSTRSPDCAVETVQVTSRLLTLFLRTYLWMIGSSPSVYRWLYNLPVGWPLRTLIRTLLWRTVNREIDRFQPDLIVATHPFPAGVAASLRLKGHLQAPVIATLTDFKPHGFWVWDGIDQYCVSSQTAAAELAADFGVPAERIAVTGVAIRPLFAELAAKVTRIAPSGERRVLVMGGGLGLGPIVEAVRSLAALPHPELQVTVICGQNRALAAELKDLFADDSRIEVVGFTTEVGAYMAQSDLLLTKPGGITCSEAMAIGLPLLLLQPLPGHEEENAIYLTKTGGAQIVDAVAAGPRSAELLFERPEALAVMRANATQAGHPRSAEAIAHQILMLSVQNPHLKTTVG